MGKILVVDDEKSIRLVLERLLKNDGHEVTVAENGQQAMTAASKQFDLALLDINLGFGPNGIDVMEYLHQNYPETVIILLTGHATLETAVAALRKGAHDYLFKPCQPDAIRASVQEGLQKRVSKQRQEQLIDKLEQNILSTLSELRSGNDPIDGDPVKPAVTPELYTAGRVTIDTQRHIARVDEQPLQLSPIEFDLLKYLSQEAPQVVTPQQLVSAIHNYEADPIEASSVIRTHIYRLRQKIKETAGTDDIIRTVRGVGYAISD